MRSWVHFAMAFCLSLSLAAAAAETVSGELEVSPRAMESRCVTMVSPHYPASAASGHESLVVTVRAIIRKSGAVSPVRVVEGDPALQMEAMNAVRAWRYRPYQRDGEPIDVVTDIRVSFEPGKPGGLISHPNR